MSGIDADESGAVAQDCWYSSGFPVRTETGKAQGLKINAHYLFDTFRAREIQKEIAIAAEREAEINLHTEVKFQMPFLCS